MGTHASRTSAAGKCRRLTGGRAGTTATTATAGATLAIRPRAARSSAPPARRRGGNGTITAWVGGVATSPSQSAAQRRAGRRGGATPATGAAATSAPRRQRRDPGMTLTTAATSARSSPSAACPLSRLRRPHLPRHALMTTLGSQVRARAPLCRAWTASRATAIIALTTCSSTRERLMAGSSHCAPSHVERALRKPF